MAKQVCDLCGSKENKIILDETGHSLSSDRNILEIPLKKIQCKKCGLVFSDINLQNKNLTKNYKKKYSYNFSNKEDAIFFTNIGTQDRSSHIFEWIMENLTKTELRKAKTIVEIGCGEGNLLEKFSKKFKNKTTIGFELNENAIKIGQKKGLDIRNLDDLKNVKADILISFAVIEHTQSPKKFLKNMVNVLKEDGILIIGQPHQDKIYYDIFFSDHLFHFSSKHLQEYGRHVDLIEYKKSIGRWPIDSFSLHLFRKSKKELKKSTRYHPTKVNQSIKYYKRVFERINKFLRKKKNVESGIAVFGLGELFSIFFCYSDLKNANIKFGIDDYPKKNHNFKFKVISSKTMKDSKNIPIILCVNKNYYNIVLRKLPSSQVWLPFKR